MNLSGHVFLWLAAVALAGMASPLVRAYASYLERRTQARAEGLLARMAVLASRDGATPGRPT